MADVTYTNLDALPSRYLTYDFTELGIRKFRPRDLSKIMRTSEEKNFVGLVKLIGDTIDQPITKLTIPDFYYTMYWHRLNSYPNSPFEVPWLSKYGTEEKYVLTNDNIVVSNLAMTKEDYEHYQGLGLHIPLISDLFDIQKAMVTADADDRWLMQRAQYIEGESLAERMDTIDGLGVEFLETIREFMVAAEHGVEEEVKVTAASSKAAMIAALKAADRVNQALLEKVGQADFAPEIETVNLTMNAMQFFPNI